MAYGTPSGTRNYAPFASDLVTDAFERCKIYFPEGRHLTSARRSLNLLLSSSWGNKGVNLFEVTPVPYLIDLVQGAATYQLPKSTISVLDTYLSIPQNGTTISNAGQSGSVIPSLLGIPLPQNVVLTTTVGSNSVNVNWPGYGTYGLIVGSDISILYPVVIAGLTLGGTYGIASLVDANNFTINVTFLANQTSSASIMGYGTTDRILGSISRTDYSGLAQKNQPGAPSVFWFNRQIQPQMTLWPVPDGAGPYQLQCFLMQQIQDVNASGGETLDLPQRFFYACVLDLARDLAMKFAPTEYAMLVTEATAAWELASMSDVEKTGFSIVPNLAGYGR